MKKEFIFLKMVLILGLVFNSVASEDEWKCFVKDKGKRYIEVYAKDKEMAIKKVSKRLDTNKDSIECYKEEDFEREHEDDD